MGLCISFQQRRIWMGIFDIKKYSFRPIRYIYEIHGKTCAICLEEMNLFKQLTVFKGCSRCSFWGHKRCLQRCYQQGMVCLC